MKNKLLLASTSATRRKILTNTGIEFIYKAPLINEEKEKKKLKKIQNPEKICQTLAKQKSIVTSLKYPSYFVLGVDTCLIYKKKFLSKPKTKKKAVELLMKLNAKDIKFIPVFIFLKKEKKFGLIMMKQN